MKWFHPYLSHNYLFYISFYFSFKLQIQYDALHPVPLFTFLEHSL